MTTSPTGAQPGLLYELWWWTPDFPLPQLPDLSTAGPPDDSQVVSNVSLATTGDRFVVRLRGWIDIPAHGAYSFRIASDDGSRLLVDGQQLLDNDGVHAATTKTSPPYCLEQGWHEIVVEYFEDSGSETLSLEMSTDGVNFAAIPDASFVH
jgi:hypothetical protein